MTSATARRARPPQAALAGAITGAAQGIQNANIFVIAPPSIQGLGTGNGFAMMIQDRSGAGYGALEGATYAMMGAAAQAPTQVQQVFSTYNTASPRVEADVDRDRALMMGVQPSDVFNTMGIYLGSSYVNDFNMLGRTFRGRRRPTGLSRRHGRYRQPEGPFGLGRHGSPGLCRHLPRELGSVPDRALQPVPAAELQGQGAPGVSSGTAIGIMENMAATTLPPGFSYEWTGLALQEKSASGGATIIFVVAVLLVFLVLAAQYEAFTLPLAVILIVPMCLLAAMLGVNALGLDNNILVQVGLVVLIALAAKNAILIVEFAKQNEGRTWPGPVGRRRRGSQDSSAPDLDDLLRLHPGGSALGVVGGRRRGDASLPRGGRVLRHDRGHRLRPAVHAGLLRDLPGLGLQDPAAAGQAQRHPDDRLAFGRRHPLHAALTRRARENAA